MNIYVSNLSFGVQQEDLKKQFAPYGEISIINIIMDRISNQSRGYAFVGMRDTQCAERAIRELNGTMLDGRSMNVKEAKPRRE